MVATSGSNGRTELFGTRTPKAMFVHDQGKLYAYKRISLKQAVLQHAISPSTLGSVLAADEVKDHYGGDGASDSKKNSAKDFFGDKSRTGSGMTQWVPLAQSTELPLHYAVKKGFSTCASDREGCH